MNLDNIVRPNIRALIPYSNARKECTQKMGVFLDANENPFGRWNRYPDPEQTELKKELSSISGIDVTQIFIGNGSDEIIDLSFRIFCEPKEDVAINFSPTYGMYRVSAGINNAALLSLPLDESFDIDIKIYDELNKTTRHKLLFLCSPNNPTGNQLSTDRIEYILSTFPGLVIIDEAYIDFSSHTSWKYRLNEFDNVLVLQTLSKARGLAGVRIGVAYASQPIIALFNKVKPPYNVSAINQDIAISALRNQKEYSTNLESILNEKQRLFDALNKCTCIQKIYPSDANFFLVKVVDADRVYESLLKSGIVVRNRDALIPNTLRITVGAAKENTKFIHALNAIQ